MPSAIVLGADGFVGRHLVAELRRRDWSCHAVGRDAGDLAADGTAERLMAAAPKAGHVFHLVTRQRTGPVQYGMQAELLAVNARIHLHVLEAWRRHQPQAKLVSAGSSCAFPEAARPLGEADFQGGPLHPSVAGYGLAKQVLAVGSRAYGEQYGLRWLHAIFATLYGPGDHTQPGRSHFVAGLVDRAVAARSAGARSFEIWGDPTTVRDLLHVDDQVDALLAADALFENELLNISANRPVTVGAVAACILDALCWAPEIVYPTHSFRGARFKTLDASRFLEGSGWRPRIALGDGIGDLLRRDYGIG